MNIRSRRMKTQATYWPPAGADVEGKVSAGAAELVLVRWQEKADVFVDAQGKEEISTAIVYVNQLVEPDGFMVRGDESAETPETLASARLIKAVQESPSLDGSETLVKVYLK